MVGKFSAAAVAVALLLGFAGPVAAGPIAVFTQVWDVGGTGHDELPVSGLGTFGVLTTGGGVNPVVTVPADQTSASSLVVGFWPVIGFANHAQYEAQLGTVITIPDTPVRLYAEVHNGAYGQAQSVERVFVDGTISGTFSAHVGQNSLDWHFADVPKQITFGDTVVTLDYEAIHMPDGVPSIYFDDGSPGIGFPGTQQQYYPTLLEAHVSVTRPPTDPNDPGDPGPGGSSSGPPGVPEPASGLLLAGLAMGGFFARARARVK
jgi:hypothetical protein